MVIPVTIPVADPMVAMPGDPELQTPLPAPSLNALIAPTHTAVGPLIGGGNGFIIIVALPLIVLLHVVVALVATTV
jgi:hypothetical protein